MAIDEEIISTKWIDRVVVQQTQTLRLCMWLLSLIRYLDALLDVLTFAGCMQCYTLL